MDIYRIDSTKIQFHPKRVSQWLEADTWELAKKVYPVYAEVTTCAACSHRCTFCSVDAIGYPQISINQYRLTEALYDMKRLGVRSVMFAGTGEPLLYKHMDDIVGVGARLGLDMAFTTNGVLLHKLRTLDLCSWVKISMNAGTRDEYAAIHQTNPKDWDSIWSHLPEVIARKGNCTLGIQAVVLPENYMTLANLAFLSKQIGLDYVVLKPYSQGTFSIVQRTIDYSEIEDELLALRDNFPGFVIYRENAIRRESESRHQYEKCMATPFMWVYLMANGDVFTCSAHLLDKRFCIGNINENSFQDIWEGERRRENWEMMRDTFDIKDCRKNCRMESANQYLDQVKHGVPHHNWI